MKSYSILIGRFQPFHLGHYALLQEALKCADETIIVLGSCNKPRSKKNPWLPEERKTMIESSLKDNEISKIHFVFMNDYESDGVWLEAMRSSIYKITQESLNITLVGHEHDGSSYYLNLFPEWKLKNLPNFDEFLHATEVRNLYFNNDSNYKKFVHNNVGLFLDNFKFDQELK